MYNDYFLKALDNIEQSVVKEAMAYSLFSNGKRLRSQLLIATAKAYGIEEKSAYPLALALEMIHTYSLIHDDLPAMDNDDYRRGLLSCHKQFDEATAILAGDALLTESFNVICNTNLSDATKIAVISVLNQAAGANGMILGQDLDIHLNADTKEKLIEVHHYKTGMLFAASFKLAALLADKTDALDSMHQLGITLGLAFQIQDDILDVISTTEDLGKSVGSDLANDKKTVLKFMTIENAQIWLNELYDGCIRRIIDAGIDDSLLLNLIGEIKNRRK